MCDPAWMVTCKVDGSQLRGQVVVGYYYLVILL